MHDLLALHLPASKDEALITVARDVAAAIASGSEISRRSLTAAMTDAFGSGDADGHWSMRDAYDALEAAQVIVLRDKLTTDTTAPVEKLTALVDVASSLPTQTYRSEGQIALQQFSTPLPLAWLAGHAAAVTRFDTVLEPSAGTGLLAVHAYRAGARLRLNELDPLRAELLSKLFPGTVVTQVDGATIADRGDDTRPSVVLMNPPYSKSAGIGDDAYAGARHLRSALLALAEGGRLVAIMPSWFTPDGSGAAGYAAVAKLVEPTFDMLIGGSVYAKHGTSIAVRLMVFDKGRVDVGTRHSAATLPKR